MKRIIGWAATNGAAMNMLMLLILIAGGLALSMLRREQFPEFELEIVLVTVPYPGASPDEVEEGICQKVEEAVRSIAGIKKITSVAAEGAGSVIIELYEHVNVQQKLNDIRSEVDRIPAFPPERAEDPEVKQLTFRQTAIRVGLIGPDQKGLPAEQQLRSVAESVRDDLLSLPHVSQVDLQGVRDYQIDVEVPEAVLRQYGVDLQDVASVIRRENLEVPGGNLRTEHYEVLVRGKNKRVTGAEIAQLPLLTQPDGVVLKVGDVATVRDGFVDIPMMSEINGRPAVALIVQRTSDEDVFQITDEVKQYIADHKDDLPEGYELTYWHDDSVMVRDRLDMLISNGIQGLLLVFLILAMFLDLRLAFWVAMGIPVSLLGSGLILLATGHTMNMLTMFAFLMALGIVVDDAIVIGENIFAHRQRGVPYLQAAIDGTVEVLPAVIASVSTTIVAFMPMMFVAGVMGKFIAVMPVAIIAMLFISLIESSLILPAHLAHKRGAALTVIETILWPFRWVGWILHYGNQATTAALSWFTAGPYRRMVRFAVDYPLLVVSFCFALLMGTFGMVMAGITPYVIMPKLDANNIQANITYPDGTPSTVADAATERLASAIQRVNAELTPPGEEPIVRLIHRLVGSSERQEGAGMGSQVSGAHLGGVSVELAPAEERNVGSSEIIDAWRAAAGEFPGAEKLTFGSQEFGPGGTPVEFKLQSNSEHFEELLAAVDDAKAKLATYDGTFDVADDNQPGKFELLPEVTRAGQATGVRSADLYETVRSSYYGEEVMRLQRGRHEVKLMVRYPPEERDTFASLDEIRVRTPEGERPITELATVEVDRGYSEINRVAQKRAITISADLDESRGNASEIVSDLKKTYLPELFKKYPNVSVRWEGQAERSAESLGSLMVGTVIALGGMFFLLTLQFKSMFQPLIIMAIIPLGAMGAIWGHAFLGIPISLFSFFGLVALSGVVVNDSIVLIDYINQLIREGVPLHEACYQASLRRLRPVLLTSLTTIAGLLPILYETSLQAQILIPMAAAIAYGLMVATALVLFVVPALYRLLVPVINHCAEKFEDDQICDPVTADLALDRDWNANSTEAANERSVQELDRPERDRTVEEPEPYRTPVGPPHR
jgi:multidrug efflux pump subunit AcrB